MAAAPTYNKAVTCLCDNLAEYHCNTCGDVLCSKCKVIHLKSKATSHHSIVEYGERLRPEYLSSVSCPDHEGKACNFWCEKCSNVACINCVTTTHQSHTFISLEAILKQKTTMLQRELANLESNELKEREDLTTEAKQMTKDYLDQVNAVGKELDVKAKEFHAKVDEIFNASKKQLEDMRETNLVILHQQEKMVADGLEKVKQEIRECEDKLRNGSMESLLQYEEKQDKKKSELPKLSPVMPPIFTPSQIDSQSLAKMFGELTEHQARGANAKIGATAKDTQKSSNKGTVTPLQETSSKSGVSESKSTPQSDQQISKAVTIQTLPQRQLIPTPSVQSSFDTGFCSYDNSIQFACVGSGLAWVKTGKRRLQLMDQHGSVKDTIETGFFFSNVVLSPQGELLLSDYRNSCIKSISPDKNFRTLFTTQWKPYGLCCLHSGDVAVTYPSEGRVVIYSMSGKIIQELDKTLFKCPHWMARNKVNNDLYICDKDRTQYDSTGKIVALNASYRLQYQYTGQSNTGFHPMDLGTDSAGRVLITDFYNDRVHILDTDGQFLQYLLTKEQGLLGPVSIDIDSEGNAWVGEYHGGVIVVKYLQ